MKKDSIENSNKVESRRGFLRNIAASVVAAGTLAPSLVKADDPYLIEEPEWGKKLGLPVDKFPYGLPSPYEHNVVRRTHELLSSGDMYASVAMCPVHELDGIITPNGLLSLIDVTVGLQLLTQINIDY